MSMIVNPTHLSWSAGIFDGEGTIRMYKITDRLNGHERILADLRITNTNSEIISESVRILRLIVKDEKPVRIYPSMTPKNKKDCFHIQISKRRAVSDILTAVIPYLIGKRAQAEVILEYVNRRLFIQPRKGGIMQPLISDDWNSLARCRSLMN